MIVEIEDVEVDGGDGHALAGDFGKGKCGHGDIHARDGVLEEGEFEGLRMRAQQTGEPASE